MEKLTFIQKIKYFISHHKIWSLLIILGLIFVSYFLFFRNKASSETRYITSVVGKGSVMTSVSGSGQIEASDTINLKTKTSGDINYIGVRAGDTVRKGQLIVSVDSRDAKLALENAQIALDKLIGDPDELSLIQKQNSLDKLYNDSWNEITSLTVDLNDIVIGLGDLHNGYLGSSNKTELSRAGKDKIDESESAYWNSKKSLDSTAKLYKSLSLSSSKSEIKSLTVKALETSRVISNALKLAQTSLDYTANSLDEVGTTEVTDVQKNLTSWTSTTNGYINNLSSNLDSIEEGTLALNDFIAGADALDVKGARLTVENKQAAYNDCFLYSPFDGVIATLTAKVGDSSSGTIGTLITKQKIATISLNEVDIAKIKLDQKATLTFDAIDDLSITGRVAGIDSVGTVSQGVVTYNVTISLDVDDQRIKPGMSISASILTGIAQDVIVVPNSAVKTKKNKTSYVEIFSAPLSDSSGTPGSTSSVLPTQVAVETGLSDDSNTEIISGLKEGDIIVTKTITSTVAKNTTSAPSILGAVGGGTRTGTGSGTMRAIEGR